MRGMCILFAAALLTLALSSSAEDVERYKRLELRFENTSWEGNPNDVILTGTFRGPSGQELKHFGFHAGGDSWAIYFMPTETGEWTWETQCDDPDLDGTAGAFTCVASDLKGPLSAEGNDWVLEGHGGDFPIIWPPPVPEGRPGGLRGREASDPVVQEALDFADETVGARLLAFGDVLIAPTGWAAEWPQEAVPYTIGKEGEEFHQPFWDRLNALLDDIRDRGMGAYIMLYADDEQKPDAFGIGPRSERELRFMRYVVARLACYPHVMWDSGIDISEYRDSEWLPWFVEWMREHDPGQHPVSSRTGGGSGGHVPDAATYFSSGEAFLPSREQLLEFNALEIPVAFTDHWRPFIDRGDWTHEKIRIATWRCALSGGHALFPDYSQGRPPMAEVEKGARLIGHATHFFREELRSDLTKLAPHDELIASGENAILAANPGVEYVAYDEDGGELTLDLSAARQALQARWYNPRNGEFTDVDNVDPGDSRAFTAPEAGTDWVLHLYMEGTNDAHAYNSGFGARAASGRCCASRGSG